MDKTSLSSGLKYDRVPKLKNRGIDYYGVLGLNQIATDLQIKQAYRRMALQFNPERQQDTSLQPLFTVLGEAYEVLSSPLLRALYDQYGEAGIKKGLVTPYGWIEPYVYHGEPLRTYQEFFGTKSPYADLLDNIAEPDKLCEYGEAKIYKKKDPSLTKTLALTLKEIYFGAEKKIKILRREFQEGNSGPTVIREKILDLSVKPGTRAGTVFTFPNAGDMSPHSIPGDIIFITEDKPDDVYERDGDNLIKTQSVTVSDALTGAIIDVVTLDDRKLKVAITEVIRPGYVKILEEEGLPNYENPNRFGDIIIKFNLDFPKYLSNPNKVLLKKALTCPIVPGSVDHANELIIADKAHRIQVQEKAKVKKSN